MQAQRWGRFVGRRPGGVLLVMLALVLGAAVYGFGVFGSLTDGGFDDPDSESSRAAALEQDLFPDQAGGVVVILSDPDRTVQDPGFRADAEQALSGLQPELARSVVTWWDTESPALVGDDGHATRALVTPQGDDPVEASERFEEIRDSVQDAGGLDVHVGGEQAIFSDVNGQVGKDIARAEIISMPLVFLLSLVIFGSVVSALMPTLVGGIAVAGAFALVRIATGFTDISVFSINVITLLGMGLAIDYALFMVSRYREELAREPDTDGRYGREQISAALGRTMATAGRTVFFSGVIVAASLSSLLLFPQVFLRSMGLGGIGAVLVAMGASLTLLPAVLALLGHRVEWGTMPWRRRRGARAARTGTPHEGVREGAWARIARSVMRRPIAYLLASTAVLLLLASPFLGASFGSVDEHVLPEDAPSRVALEKQSQWFGGEQSSASIVVRDADQGTIERYREALARVPDVDSVRVTGQTGQDTLIDVGWQGRPQSQASQDLIGELRDVPLDSGDRLVGGSSAATVDLIDSLTDRLPWMALFVAVVMLVLLFIAFGSVVLPLKAMVMNLLSITASFGVVTWIFADGHLSGLLGFTSPGYLDVTQPILMLAILYGLSMDYEVFLLSRVREEWDRTHDNTTAVAMGVQRTGRIITSAALLLAVVIGGFATSGIVFLKMIGVGMLVAVLLDATVVRALLVPATMRLLGKANWWAPGPMARWWDRHGHREEIAEEPEKELVSH